MKNIESYLEIIIITVSLVGWRLNVEIVSEINPYEVSIISDDCSEALDAGGIVVRVARREEFFGDRIAVGKVLAILLLQLWWHGLDCWGRGLHHGQDR